MGFICSAFISGSLISPVCAETPSTTKVQLWGFTPQKKICGKSELSSARLSCPVLSGGTCGCPQTWGCLDEAPSIIPGLWMLVAQKKGSLGVPIFVPQSLISVLNVSPAAFPHWWWMEKNVWVSPWYPWAVQRCPNLSDFNTTLFSPLFKTFQKTDFLSKTVENRSLKMGNLQSKLINTKRDFSLTQQSRKIRNPICPAFAV